MKPFLRLSGVIMALAVFLVTFVCVIDYFVNVGPGTRPLPLTGHPEVWCSGDAVSFRNSVLIVEDGLAKYAGTITNTCKYPEIISVIVKVGREDGVTAAPDDFFLAKNGEPVMPSETVAYARYIELSDNPTEQKFHTYNIHKYGSASVDADPNAGKD